jgi:hypothetical protein
VLARSWSTIAPTCSSIGGQNGLLRSRVGDPGEIVIAADSPLSSQDPMLGMPPRPLLRAKP